MFAYINKPLTAPIGPLLAPKQPPQQPLQSPPTGPSMGPLQTPLQTNTPYGDVVSLWVVHLFLLIAGTKNFQKKKKETENDF